MLFELQNIISFLSLYILLLHCDWVAFCYYNKSRGCYTLFFDVALFILLSCKVLFDAALCLIVLQSAPCATSLELCVHCAFHSSTVPLCFYLVLCYRANRDEMRSQAVPPAATAYSQPNDSQVNLINETQDNPFNKQPYPQAAY